MDASELRALQAPLKTRYREAPETAIQAMHARGHLDASGLVCRVETARGVIDAGLHPAAGGDGSNVCAGDMLLEALVGCAGVTLKAVATALEIPVRGGTIVAEGTMDFRGTLGVDRQVPVGFTRIDLRLDLDTDASPEQLETLLKLTERYCVVWNTLSPNCRGQYTCGLIKS